MISPLPDVRGATSPRHAMPPVTRISHCRVDAGGVPAEWVEATVATEGQPTLVYFFSGGGHDAFEASRPLARRVAAATGARVLIVDCRAAVERALAAYAWLLGEGCDLDLTLLTTDGTNRSLLRDLRLMAAGRGLPLPAGDIPVTGYL